jgi:DNA replication and repair protein RecF
LPLSRIRISTLRCLRDVDLGLHAARNYFFGPNGAGKTSVLEGIFVLGRGRSFRTRQLPRLVQHGSEGFTVYGEVMAAGITRRLGVAYQAGRLEKKIDGETAPGMAALAALLPVHAIEPSMHALVEGGPSERRRFLDWGVFHVEHGYLEAWKRYRRVLSQRNAALKRGAGNAELHPWSEALVEAAAVVDQTRSRYLERLAPFAAEVGRRLLERPVALEYRRGWSADHNLADVLAATLKRDRQRGNTEAGPHRAEVVLRLDERRAQDEASRGQQKLMSAALILAQVAVEAVEHAGQSVLIVDDPAAELDAGSLARLLGALADLRTQLVFTALTPAALPIEAGSHVFHVERGEVRRL